jgi:adenylate cyclase
MNRRRLAGWLVVAACLAACSTAPVSMVARAGALDLTDYSFERDGLVSLDGGWQLYWNRLLMPADLSGPAAPASDGVYDLPSSWNSLQLNGQPLPRNGFLTMRLQVRLPAGKHNLAIAVPSFNTAYKVWVNGNLVAASGQVGTNATEAQAAGFQQIANFETDSPTVDVVAQASNFDGVPGGPIGRFRVGPREAVAAWDYQQIALDMFVISACFIIGLYYVVLYVLRRKEQAFILFGVFNVLFGVRNLLVGREVVHLILPTLSWDVSLRLLFFTGLAAGAVFMAFVSTLYASDAWRWGRRAALLGGGVGLIPLFMPPAYLFGPLNILYNGLVAAAIVYSVLVGVRAVRNGRPGALLLLLSSVPLAVATGVEALGSARLIPLYSLAGFGVLGTLAAQTFILLRNFTLAFAAVEALSERLDRTSKAYYRFVPRELLRLIGKEDIVAVELGDQTERSMTILFADVRGFTSLSERMSPDENFQFINTYLGRVGPIMREHHGFIDKYMGDGFMALFPERPEDALSAAIEMRRSLAELNADRERRGEPAIKIGIGLHLGTLMLGTVGEPQRMDGTVIADAVNTAARLESLTKQYAATIIISAQTLKAMADWNSFRIRTLGKIRVKGKADAVTIYEVFDGDPEAIAQAKRLTLDQFEIGVNLFQAGRFEEATEQFQRVAAANPGDLPAAQYVQRAARFATTGAPKGWDGVETLTEK